MLQEGLAAARLVSWTKSFNCPGVEGEEVGGLLQAALDEVGLPVRVAAVLNDTTGTLGRIQMLRFCTSVVLLIINSVGKFCDDISGSVDSCGQLRGPRLYCGSHTGVRP